LVGCLWLLGVVLCLGFWGVLGGGGGLQCFRRVFCEWFFYKHSLNERERCTAATAPYCAAWHKPYLFVLCALRFVYFAVCFVLFCEQYKDIYKN